MEQKRNYTNGDYKRLGGRIRKDCDNIAQEDYQMLQDLRIANKSALATTFKALHLSLIHI